MYSTTSIPRLRFAHTFGLMFTIIRNTLSQKPRFRGGDPEKFSTGTDSSHLNIYSVFSLLFAVHFYNDVAIFLLNWIVVFISIRSVSEFVLRVTRVSFGVFGYNFEL